MPSSLLQPGLELGSGFDGTLQGCSGELQEEAGAGGTETPAGEASVDPWPQTHIQELLLGLQSPFRAGCDIHPSEGWPLEKCGVSPGPEPLSECLKIAGAGGDTLHKPGSTGVQRQCSAPPCSHSQGT